MRSSLPALLCFSLASALAVSLALAPASPVLAQEDHHHATPPAPVLQLSDDLQQLLRREMLEIDLRLGDLVRAVAKGEWAFVSETATGIENSFVLKQNLTPELRTEIGGLPEDFRRLDRRFHGTGGALAEAARSGDEELVVFYTSRLLESCTECHGRYAGHRFPGFE